MPVRGVLRTGAALLLGTARRPAERAEPLEPAGQPGRPEPLDRPDAADPTGLVDSSEPRAAADPGGRGRVQSAEEVAGQAMSKLFGRDSLFMIVWAVQLVIGAGLTPAITRLMGGSEFGQVSAATAVMQILFVLTGLGMETAVQRHYAGRDGAAESGRLLGFAIIAATVVTVAADLTGRWWAGALGFASYSPGLRLAVAWAGVTAVTATVLSLLRSQDRLCEPVAVGRGGADEPSPDRLPGPDRACVPARAAADADRGNRGGAGVRASPVGALAGPPPSCAGPWPTACRWCPRA